jgi:PTH1 family peptidyl-tRNA hydrolase
MPQLVIGLGNPGPEYVHSRHNMGFSVLDELERLGHFTKPRRERELDALVSRGEVEGFEMVLARPTTFMNDSGRAGIRLTRALSVAPADVIVAHDDIDLKLGRLRLRRGGSSGGNNGIRSLHDAWRTQDFIRVRVGVGKPEGRDAVIGHVLSRFHPDERELANLSVRRAAEATVDILRIGLEQAMTKYNRADAVSPNVG